MNWKVLIAGTILLPASCLAGCEIRIPSASVKAVNIELRERAKNILSIASGYRKSDASEAMWLMQLSADIQTVSNELIHLRELISIRDGIVGAENQRIVKNVFTDALIEASKLAQATKEHLLESTSFSINSAVTSEIARTVPSLEKVVHLGDSCESKP